MTTRSPHEIQGIVQYRRKEDPKHKDAHPHSGRSDTRMEGGPCSRQARLRLDWIAKSPESALLCVKGGGRSNHHTTPCEDVIIFLSFPFLYSYSTHPRQIKEKVISIQSILQSMSLSTGDNIPLHQVWKSKSTWNRHLENTVLSPLCSNMTRERQWGTRKAVQH